MTKNKIKRCPYLTYIIKIINNTPNNLDLGEKIRKLYNDNKADMEYETPTE